jgi:hypothetical protein
MSAGTSLTIVPSALVTVLGATATVVDGTCGGAPPAVRFAESIASDAVLLMVDHPSLSGALAFLLCAETLSPGFAR